jgi:hypothetical protein
MYQSPELLFVPVYSFYHHYIMIGTDGAWSCFAAIMIAIRRSH